MHMQVNYWSPTTTLNTLQSVRRAELVKLHFCTGLQHAALPYLEGLSEVLCNVLCLCVRGDQVAHRLACRVCSANRTTWLSGKFRTLQTSAPAT